MWNLKGTEKAQVDQSVVTMLLSLKNDGIIPAETVVDEINAKKIFMTELSTDDIPDIEEIEYNNQDENINAGEKLQELKDVISGTQLKAKTV